MPSKSKAQQRFMGLVHGLKKGDISSSDVSKKVKKAASSMSKKSVKDFASTKHKGLPKKVKQETKVRSLIRKMVREIMAENKIKISKGHGRGQSWTNYHDDKGNRLQVTKVGNEYTAYFSKAGVSGGKNSVLLRGLSKNDAVKVVKLTKKAGIEKTKTAVKSSMKKYVTKEGFGGAMPKNERGAFDSNRKKQSEVLGYKLTGKNDIKTEIDDALSEMKDYKTMMGAVKPKKKKVQETKVKKPKVNKVLKNLKEDNKKHRKSLGLDK